MGEPQIPNIHTGVKEMNQAKLKKIYRKLCEGEGCAVKWKKVDKIQIELYQYFTGVLLDILEALREEK